MDDLDAVEEGGRVVVVGTLDAVTTSPETAWPSDVGYPRRKHISL